MKNSYRSLEKSVFIVFILMIIGTFLGSFSVNFFNAENYSIIKQYITDFINTPKVDREFTFEVILTVFLKYMKINILLWFLGFLAIGKFLSYVVVLIKGMGYGFTTTLLLNTFGIIGIKYCFSLYFFQNIILIFSYMFICYNSFKFRNKEINLKEYFLVLLIAIIFVFCVIGIDFIFLKYI